MEKYNFRKLNELLGINNEEEFGMVPVVPGAWETKAGQSIEPSSLCQSGQIKQTSKMNTKFQNKGG